MLITTVVLWVLVLADAGSDSVYALRVCVCLLFCHVRMELFFGKRLKSTATMY